MTDDLEEKLDIQKNGRPTTNFDIFRILYTSMEAISQEGY